MAIPTGAHYVPGTNRRQVQLADGTTVKRQEAENLFARQHGFRNERERRQATSSAGFKAFQRRPGYQRAIKEAQIAGRSKAEANAAFARYYQNETQNSRDTSPDGALAQMLVAMGRRSPASQYAVGDSPTIY